MKRLAVITLVALFCVLFVFRPAVSRAYECTDGGLLVNERVNSFGFGHRVPCGWRITLEGQRTWKLASSGRVPLTVTPIGDGCAVKQLGIRPLNNGYIETTRIKVTGESCTFDVRLNPPEDIPGFVWYFFMWDVAQGTFGQ